ncbi:hypothetical protein Jab_2c11550 [Janthinobacterium sp. HH01]|uniref:DUF4259 domain-containing protein n=1 Tax=Janthinobacterium sp. HH01 TaxID=1198452 RepID=UPI0002AE865E|nr:DUF4259 domain-containing protein [Janthinobacterium sp. HH01]ELX09095.1 hypothetical protein Jab_2c11550 [Janthinobacterium sp. HH01]
MGTWAVDAFGNDYAQDWAEDLEQTSNLEAVESTLDTALENNGGMLEAPFGAEALVAIEVLARLQGKGGERSEDSAAVDAWVDARRPKARVRTDLAEKAGRAIERILSEQSELRELWADSEHYADWRAAVEELRGRIAA